MLCSDRKTLRALPLHSFLVAGDRMPFYRTDRREFITLLGGAAVLPLARAANGSSSTDWCAGSHTPQRLIVKARIALSAFRDTLQRLGLTDGRNVSIDARWGAGDPDRIRSYSKPVATSPLVVSQSKALHGRPPQSRLPMNHSTTDLGIPKITPGSGS
jgi:hypothetical protein